MWVLLKSLLSVVLAPQLALGTDIWYVTITDQSLPITGPQSVTKKKGEEREKEGGRKDGQGRTWREAVKTPSSKVTTYSKV